MNTKGVHNPALRGPRAKMALLLLLALLMACDQLLDVDNPAAVEAEFLERPENAQLLVTNAVTDFECAFGHYVVAGGLIGTELTRALRLDWHKVTELVRLTPSVCQAQWNPQTGAIDAASL